MGGEIIGGRTHPRDGIDRNRVGRNWVRWVLDRGGSRSCAGLGSVAWMGCIAEQPFNEVVGTRGG